MHELRKQIWEFRRSGRFDCEPGSPGMCQVGLFTKVWTLRYTTVRKRVRPGRNDFVAITIDKDLLGHALVLRYTAPVFGDIYKISGSWEMEPLSGAIKLEIFSKGKTKGQRTVKVERHE
ncbi:hypothetical protein RRG08_054063 [Elysia crispata]|uniref:Uncharacterized protein n=1 Tax=Elysia crispata TaxID=231223 RepID=A0AAE0ZD03_9GAST|nr:hypothetical protein RRG08_054063 [Elysia crispata]